MSEFRELVESEVAKIRGNSVYAKAEGGRLEEADEITIAEIPKELLDLVKPLGKVASPAWSGIHGYVLNVEAPSRSDGRLKADDLRRLANSKLFRWISPNRDGSGWSLGLSEP